MTDFILVPGAWHGGWWYAPVVEALEGRGHRAHAVTLAGLEDEAGNSGPGGPDRVVDLLLSV